MGWCNIWLEVKVWRLAFLFQWLNWWRCCDSLWLNHVLIMLKCSLTANLTTLLLLFFSPLEAHSAQYLELISLSPQHLGIWPLRCWTLAFYMHFQIWLCYSTVWHFQRSQPLLVHLVPAMSMFLCSTWVFLGQVSEVQALLGPQKGLIGIADQFSAGPPWSFLPDAPSLIPQV